MQSLNAYPLCAEAAPLAPDTFALSLPIRPPLRSISSTPPQSRVSLLPAIRKCKTIDVKMMMSESTILVQQGRSYRHQSGVGASPEMTPARFTRRNVTSRAKIPGQEFTHGWLVA